MTKKQARLKAFLKDLPMMMLWGVVAGFTTYAVHSYSFAGTYDRLDTAVTVVLVGLFAGSAVHMPVFGILCGMAYFFGSTYLAVEAMKSPVLSYSGATPQNFGADLVTLVLLLAPGLLWILRGKKQIA